MTWYARNKKVHTAYDIQERYEAGIALFGYEVKSVRSGGVSLFGAYVTVNETEAFLHEVYIPPYQAKNTPTDYDPRRTRKLLLNKKQIRELRVASKQPRLTIVPVGMYNKNNRVKVEIALARGKKKHDKREQIKKKDAQRDVARSLKKNIQL